MIWMRESLRGVSILAVSKDAREPPKKRRGKTLPTPEKALQILLQSVSAAGGQSAQDQKAERKPRPAQYTVFRFVVQTDNPHQMDVFRWLISDSAYTVVWILHDRDRYAPEDMDENRRHVCSGCDSKHMDAEGNRVHELDEYGRHVRKGWQHIQEFHVGDLKPAHIHGIVKTGRKCTGETMSGRFGQYVHFEGVSDVQQCALYLTHRTYDARTKFQYPEFAVQGDLDYYAECAGLGQNECDMCRRWLGYCAAARDNFADGGALDSGAIFALAVKLAIAAGDKSLVKNVMSHSYFYKNLQ